MDIFEKTDLRSQSLKVCYACKGAVKRSQPKNKKGTKKSRVVRIVKESYIQMSRRSRKKVAQAGKGRTEQLVRRFELEASIRYRRRKGRKKKRKKGRERVSFPRKFANPRKGTATCLVQHYTRDQSLKSSALTAPNRAAWTPAKPPHKHPKPCSPRSDRQGRQST